MYFVAGKLRDASACYERAIQLEPDEIRHHKGLLQSLVDLGQLNSALIHVNGLLTERYLYTCNLKYKT